MKTNDISDNEIKILGQEWQESEKIYPSISDKPIRVLPKPDLSAMVSPISGKFPRMQKKLSASKISIILLSALLLSALLFIVYLLTILHNAFV